MSDRLAPEVVTVTLNPAIDLTVAVDRLVVGAVQRASAAVSNCGGKGVNVAGCLADWGVRVAITGVLGDANERAFDDFFADKGIVDLAVRAPGATRTNIKIADRASGETTDINLPGLKVSNDAFEAVRATLKGLIVPGRPVALSGSLPESLPDGAWATLAGDLATLGARVVLDTSGEPLAAALRSGHPIHALKPNRAELEALLGRGLPTMADLIAAAQSIVNRGVACVVVSLGADGALFVDRETALVAALPAKTVLSTVGAGDAMVAGICAALVEAAPLERVARLAVAFAASKLDRIGPHLGRTENVERLAAAVRVTASPL